MTFQVVLVENHLDALLEHFGHFFPKDDCTEYGESRFGVSWTFCVWLGMGREGGGGMWMLVTVFIGFRLRRCYFFTNSDVFGYIGNLIRLIIALNTTTITTTFVLSYYCHHHHLPPPPPQITSIGLGFVLINLATLLILDPKYTGKRLDSWVYAS